MVRTQRNRPAQILCSFLVVLAMCVSAIAACACVHHEPGEPISCHSGSREKAVQLDGLSFDASCICIESNSVKAVTVKAEQKRHTEQPAAQRYLFDTIIHTTATTHETSPAIQREQRIYRHLFIRSGPSRAPPAL